MNLIFMGTSEFAIPSLARLISDGYHLACVFTRPDKPAGRGNKLQSPPVKLLASQHLIDVHQPDRIKGNEEVRAIFERAAPDACIVAAYGRILPDWLLSIPRLGCVNVHASLLPKYRGAAPVNWAIAGGETETGITIMQMDVGMDTGPILAQRTTAIGPAETALELSERLAAMGAESLSETLPAFAGGAVKPVPQDDTVATYAPLLKREDGLVDWTMPAAALANRVRAFQPWPGTYSQFRGRRLMIWRAQPATPAGEIGSPRLIIEVDDPAFTVACGGNTALRIDEVQIEGKRRVSGREFANGARLRAGDRLE